MAPQQLQMIFQSFNSPSMAEGSSVQVRRALPYRQIQSLDIRRIQFLRVLGGSPEFFPAPRGTRSSFPVHLDDAIIPPLLDHLTKHARRAEDSLHHLPIELESVGSDQRNRRCFRAGADILKQPQGIPIAAIPHSGGWPESGTYLDGRKDPDLRFFTAAGHGANLISLQFHDLKHSDPVLVKLATGCSSDCQPTIHSVPAETLHTRDRGFVHTPHTHHRNGVESGAPMLQTKIDCPAR